MFKAGDRIEICGLGISIRHFRGQTGTVKETKGAVYCRVQLDIWPRGELHMFLQNEMKNETWREHRVIRDYSDETIILTQTERNFMASSAAYMAFEAQDFDNVRYWQERAVNEGIIYG